MSTPCSNVGLADTEAEKADTEAEKADTENDLKRGGVGVLGTVGDLGYVFLINTYKIYRNQRK